MISTYSNSVELKLFKNIISHLKEENMLLIVTYYIDDKSQNTKKQKLINNII